MPLNFIIVYSVFIFQPSMTICHPVPVKASAGEKTSHPHEEDLLQLTVFRLHEQIHAHFDINNFWPF